LAIAASNPNPPLLPQPASRIYKTPLERDRRAPPPRTLSRFASTDLAAAAMAIDILGERQSGQDVRTQNGNCRHPFLPLPSDSAGGRAGVCEIYWPESPLGAFCFSY